MTDQDDDGLLGPGERDLMRGIGQWMVFLDHVPYDIVSWLTLRPRRNRRDGGGRCGAP